MMSRLGICIISFVLFSITLSVTAVSPDEEAGLLAFYNALSTASRASLTGYVAGTDACTWTGVTCSNAQVTKLKFDGGGFGLSGTLSPNITLLSNLQEFNIDQNMFTGTVPENIYRMTSLRTLRLSNNQLSGTLPYSIEGMSNLQKLYVNVNRFTGFLPQQVAGLSGSMNYFSAANNNLEGPISSGYGALTKLQYFLVNVNHLNGTIPASLGNLIYVQQMKLGSNQLTGTIPPELGGLSSCLQLHMYSNLLSGSIPATLGNLKAIQQLHLYQNDLTGTIPAALGSATTMTELQLYKNDLTGTIPTTIGDLTAMTTLSLYQNQLKGSIPLSITTLTSLRVLRLNNNQLRGEIPAGIQSAPLTTIALDLNQFSGNFPSFWATRSDTITFTLTSNCWNDSSIPTWLAPNYVRDSRCGVINCGNGFCSASENCSTCADDCPSPCDYVGPIDECSLTPNGGCDPLTNCTDTAYSFKCSACPSGYTGTGLSGCVDINECQDGTDDCDPYMQCINIPGSFNCTNCGPGSYQSGHTCIDINECNTNNGGCSPFRACVNLIKNGSYCGACAEGRIPIGNTSCSELDRCFNSQFNNCSVNAVCTHPNATNIDEYICTCKPGFTGDGYVCNDDGSVRKLHEYNTPLSGGLGAVVAVGVFIAIFACVMLGLFWDKFAKHGSFYCAVIVVGVALSYVAALTVLPEHTDSLCLVFPWFLGISFSLVYGCLFIKTWALYRVWRNATNFKKTAMTPFYIIRLLAINLSVEVIFLIIWTIVDPPKVVMVKMVDDTWAPLCESDSNAWWGVFLGYKGAWLIFGAVLSILTRDVAKEYNESGSIAYATYNNVVLGVIAVPLALVLKKVPGGVEIIEVATIVLAFTFTMCILFFSIWYNIFFPEKHMFQAKLQNRGNTSSSTEGKTTATQNKSSSHSSMDSSRV